jgi:hypothetical protein
VAKKNQTPTKLDTTTPVRDSLIVALICGVTKTGFQKDRKKHANRTKCRGRVTVED